MPKNKPLNGLDLKIFELGWIVILNHGYEITLN